jgi:uncharacterized sulfatase
MVAYDDLLHVPLVVRYPRLYPAGVRVQRPVSMRRVFHTALEAAGVTSLRDEADSDGPPVDLAALSLRTVLAGNGDDPDGDGVLAEVYPPDTLIHLMEAQDPAAIDEFRCRAMRRAIYHGAHKLISVDEQPDELFDTAADPGEMDNRLASEPERAAALHQAMEAMVAEAELRRPETWAHERLRLQEDQALQERLRGLGYIE